MNEAKSLYSLIPLEQFKTLAEIDEREDALARFCLIAAAFSIEQYCRRRLLRKKHFERIEYSGGVFLPLREYPVSKILAVYLLESGDILAPEFYRTNPLCGTNEDWPYTLVLSPAVKKYKGISAVKAVYWAGYSKEKVPPDLASASLELADWNFRRYRGKRAGMTGMIRGSGKDGEHFELNMPENVRSLLEPYKRKVI